MTASPAARRDDEDTSDQQLVARVRAGDDRAFECLYHRYHRRIASYVNGMVKDHARAEDLTQDVFMSALRRMRETDRAIAFKPWIYEIAKNACIDQFRRSRRAEEVSMDADDSLGSSDYGRLVSSTPTPDVAVDHKQQIDHLRGAFGGLSETHHEILVMRELEGLSYREIGEKLDMTRPAVESTLFRARRRLTEEYDELVTGERCVRVQQIITAADGSALGTRDRRRVARHVSYCQPCMRHARAAGLDSATLVQKPIRARIAGLLPLPAFLRERWAPGGADAPPSVAQWSMQASLIDPGVVSGWSKAAATAATIAIAGIGAGVVSSPPESALGGSSVVDIVDRFRSGADRDERLADRSPDRRSERADRDRRGGDGARKRRAARRAKARRDDRRATRTRTRTRVTRTASAGGSTSGGASAVSAPATSGGGGTTSGGGDTLGGALPKLTDTTSGGTTAVPAPAPSLEIPDLPSVDSGTTSGTTEETDASVGDVVDDMGGLLGDAVGGG